MFQPHAIAMLLTGWMMSLGANAALPVHKCVVNGAVTFQHEPCEADVNRPPPKAAQASAERPKPSAVPGGTTPPQPEPVKPRALPSTPPSPLPSNVPAGRGADRQPVVVPGLPSPAVGAFRCDGRQHCSQMTSCAEATHFMNNCPGAKVDGDHDGRPCETQWCKP